MARRPINGIVLDKPNDQQRIFPAEATLHAFRLRTSLVVCLCPGNRCAAWVTCGRSPLTYCGLAVGFERDGDQIVADLQLLDTEAGRMVATLLDEDAVDLRVGGSCHVGRNNILSNIEISRIRAVPREAIALSRFSREDVKASDTLDPNYRLWLRRVVEAKRDSTRNAMEHEIASVCLQAIDTL